MKASKQQINLFFALVGDGGWDKEKTVSKVRKMLKLQKFTDITSSQLSPLITEIQGKLAAKQQAQESKDTINQLHVRMYDPAESKLLYSHLTAVGRNQGVIMYFPVGDSKPSQEENGLDFNMSTSKYDRQNHLMYHYDIFFDGKDRKTTYLVDWDEEKLQWIGVETKTDKITELYKFKNPLVIGTVYTGVEENA